MAGLEELCLERFFLEPGSARPIGSVYASDDDILQIFSTADLEEARKAFIQSLPRGSLLKDYLAGEILPIAERKPDYVRILIFLCWMQTTKARQRGDRDFREMLERHLGDRYRGASMRGLNPMWEHLQNYLQAEHNIDLDLPGIHPHTQIGRTLRIAFPTWRDRAALRRLRATLPSKELLNPLAVANRVSTSKHLLSDTMQSLDYNFEHFNQVRKRGGREYMETPFWQAWYTVVAEQASLEDLQVREGEFGDFELFRVSPLGEQYRIERPEDATKFVPKSVAQSIRKGCVLLESLGFGRYRATSTTETTTLLVKRCRMEEVDQVAVLTSIPLNSDWTIATFRGRTDTEHSVPASEEREFGWRDGIRVGSAYLGRSPLAPRLGCHPGVHPVVRVDGLNVEMLERDSVFELPKGTYSGVAVAQVDPERQEILLVPKANEVAEARRLSFDASRHISEDEFYQGTTPSPEREIESWEGVRAPPNPEIVTIGEALYARSARSLALGEAFEIVSRGSIDLDTRPSEWQTLRCFVDAGWFEAVLQRHFPARLMLLRPLTAERIGGHAVRISGPTPLAVIERLEASARAAGARLERLNGVSPWSLPRFLVHTSSTTQQNEFLQRAQLEQISLPSQSRPVADQGDNGFHGYHVVNRLDEDRYFFVPTDTMQGHGLFRMARKEERNPYLYCSSVDGRADAGFVSPSVAMLFHQVRQGLIPFEHDGCVISPCRNRTYLPSSWARWLSDRTMCNAGPRQTAHGWCYAYAADHRSLQLLSDVVPIRGRKPGGARWIEMHLASATNKGRRMVFDATTKAVRGNNGASRTDW